MSSKRFFERNGLIWNSSLPPTERFVLMALNEFSDHEGQNCYPGQQTLADMTGYNRRTIIRALESMKDKGLVDWITNGKKHAKTATNDYQINFATLEHQHQKNSELKPEQEPIPVSKNTHDTKSQPPCDFVSLGTNTQTSPCDPVSHPLEILCHTPL